MLHLPFPVRDANTTSGGGGLGDLPEWNLDDLYSGEDATELKRDLDWLEEACRSFAGDYEGKLADLDAAPVREQHLRLGVVGLLFERLVHGGAVLGVVDDHPVREEVVRPRDRDCP